MEILILTGASAAVAVGLFFLMRWNDNNHFFDKKVELPKDDK